MRIGLTGGIACGKSTVGRALASLGARVLDTDQVTRHLYATDVALREALRTRWGAGIFSAAGELDRKAVAAIVFGRPAELAWLEGEVHPRVRAFWLGQLAAEPSAPWVVEIPLLYEKNLEGHFDFVVCVVTSLTRQTNWMTARGMSAAEAQARGERQWPLAEKARRAEIVFTNDGSLAFLHQQVAFWWARQMAKAASVP